MLHGFWQLFSQRVTSTTLITCNSSNYSWWLFKQPIKAIRPSNNSNKENANKTAVKRKTSSKEIRTIQLVLHQCKKGSLNNRGNVDRRNGYCSRNILCFLHCCRGGRGGIGCASTRSSKALANGEDTVDNDSINALVYLNLYVFRIVVQDTVGDADQPRLLYNPVNKSIIY